MIVHITNNKCEVQSQFLQLIKTSTPVNEGNVIYIVIP